MIDIFYNAIDCTGQFICFIQFCEMTEVIAIPIIFKRMLNIPCDGTVYIFRTPAYHIGIMAQGYTIIFYR